MNDKMALAMEPLPVSPCHGATWTAAGFGRFNPVRRVESPSKVHQPEFTLESLADLLSTSPNGGFNYLSGDVYNSLSLPSNFPPNNGERPYVTQRSRSFPRVKRDEPRKSCVHPDGAVVRRTKSVRFADSQGLPLIEAVHPLTSSDPSYTENKIVPYTDEEIFGQAVAHSAATSSGRTVESPNTLATSSGRTVEPPNTLTTRTLQINTTAISRMGSPRRPKQPIPSSPPHVHTLEFTQPGSEPGFFERVSREHVILESIREEARSMHGVVRVSNLAFEKEVTVRWTHDNWRTNHDTHAIFCANDGFTDRFTFELPVNGDDVSFAIRFRVQGQEFWDSNRGQNYLISSKR